VRELKRLFDNNRLWAEAKVASDPAYFTSRVRKQDPDYLWIGCSDSRVMANDLVGLDAGELFVHRNIGNLVVHTDFNMLSVLQYGVDFLRVKHIIVCGHYECGGVKAAMQKPQMGLADNWLRNIRDVYAAHRDELDALTDPQARYDRLVELNVHRQVFNVCHTNIVQNAWARGEKLAVHGWIYGLRDGILRDMNLCISSAAQIDEIYAQEPESERWLQWQ
jgi:carbonic anhydrase